MAGEPSCKVSGAEVYRPWQNLSWTDMSGRLGDLGVVYNASSA